MPERKMSYDEKVKIMTMAKDGKPVREIASQMNRSKSANCQLLRRSCHLPAGVTPPDKPVPGRPKKIDRGTLRRIKIALIKNPWLTAAELKNKFQNELKMYLQEQYSVAVNSTFRCQFVRPPKSPY